MYHKTDVYTFPHYLEESEVLGILIILKKKKIIEMFLKSELWLISANREVVILYRVKFNRFKSAHIEYPDQVFKINNAPHKSFHPSLCSEKFPPQFML